MPIEESTKNSETASKFDEILQEVEFKEKE